MPKPQPARPQTPPQNTLRTILLGILLVASLAIILWLALSPSSYFSKPTPPIVTVPEVVEHSPAAQPAPEPEIQQPIAEPAPEPSPTPLPTISAPEVEKIQASLNDSDAVFLKKVSELSPKVVSWLVSEQQIRKWVMLVDQLAEEHVPVQDRPLIYPAGKFLVVEKADQIWISSNNFNRTQPLINAILAIEPQKLAAFYQQFSPLLNEAYAELGRDDSFHDRLDLAIENILKVKPLRNLEEVKQPAVFYLYADAHLESASRLTKILWRLGPDNTQRIQHYLRELRPQL